MNARDICDLAPVIPVITVKDVAHAVPLAKALVAGGLPALEVTLRTPVALEAIRAMADVEGGVVGAGTLLTADDVKKAKAAGARYGVSPGFTTELLDAAEGEGLPLLPGVNTPSEVMTLLARGYEILKFFPAGAAGGPAMLKGMGAPLAAAKFCPTGGVSAANATDYLSLSNVVCVGGSWVAPGDLMAKGDWDGITALAKEAATLPR